MYLCTDYHFNKLKNNTKMKKVQTLMLMLLVAVMGMTVQSWRNRLFSETID